MQQYRYLCETCGALVADFALPEADSRRLGFDALTPEEAAAIISHDPLTGITSVFTICDNCLEHLDDDTPQMVFRIH